MAGETVIFTITLYNDGPSVARDVDVKDILPEGLTLEEIETSQGYCVGTICQLGSLAPDSTTWITVSTTVDPGVISGTELCNNAVYFGDTPDPDNSDDEDEHCVTVETLADLTVEKIGPTEPVVPGEAFDYTILVQNLGPSEAQGVILEDALPVEVDLIDVEPDPISGPNPLIWDLGTLAVGESIEVSIRVLLAEWVTETFTNTASLTSTTPDPDPDNNQDDESVLVTPLADLELVKSASDTVNAGGTITYTLLVYNHDRQML